MRRSHARLIVAIALCTAACRVGPRYQRPNAELPAAYRSAPLDSTRNASIAEARWWQLFRDAELQRLITTALNENYDVGIAATRILQARAQLAIVHASEFPTITGGAEAMRQKTPAAILGN